MKTPFKKGWYGSIYRDILCAKGKAGAKSPRKGGLRQETIPPKRGIFGPLLRQSSLPAARMPAPLFLASGLNLPFSVLRSFVSFYEIEKDRASFKVVPHEKT